jgi:hypothetical protein
MKRVSVLLIGILSIGTVYTEPLQATALSERRFPDETYQSALLRNLPTRSLRSGALETEYDRSVFNSLTTLEEVNISTLPEVLSEAVAFEMHRRLRDTRSWTWNEMQDFPRRLSWLYPEDGCYLRADLMVSKLKEWGYTRPKQAFVLGDLSFESLYEKVNWWYHVAPIVRVGTQAYVIDPAIDYQRPLLLKDWVQRISEKTANTQIAVCEAGAISPDDPCNSVEPTWNSTEREMTLQAFLGSEWSGLEAVLGQSPSGILGDSPPWESH